MRKEFAASISERLALNENLVVILGDIGIGSFEEIKKQIPNRVINVGILEQSMISFASGLVLSGKQVVLHTIAPFLVGRAYDQLKVDFGYRRLAGLFVSVGASFDYGKLGSTHHSPEDLLLISTIPGSRLLVPGSAGEVRKLIDLHFVDPKIDYLRLSALSHEYGTLNHLQILNMEEKPKATIFAVGPAIKGLVEVSRVLSADLVYLNQLEYRLPIDHLVRSRAIIFVEHGLRGSAEFLLGSEQFKRVPTTSMGAPIGFQTSYVEVQERMKLLGLDGEAVALNVAEWIRKNAHD